ncbi:MAG: hypothetical protein VX603_19295 [Gemmatimonadota bacterium]|nr:hypothetical protein [Gemmatimonadota bacterium]
MIINQGELTDHLAGAACHHLHAFMDNTQRAVYNDIYGIALPALFKQRIPGSQRNDLHRRRNLFQLINRHFSKKIEVF